MTSKTVFDVSQQGFTPERWLLIGPSLTVVGALLVFKPDFMPEIFRLRYYGSQAGRAGKIFSWFYFLFAMSWTAIVLPWSFASYWTASSHLDSGNYKVAEGPVTDFVAGVSEKGIERFTVQKRQFSYSEYSPPPGFKKTVLHGGPIREGLQVRIAYTGNTILRLEINQ